MSIRIHRKAMLALSLWGFVAVAGCVSSGERDDARQPLKPLTVDAWGASSSVVAERPLPSDEFLDRVNRALREGRKASADRFVRRFPDVAQQALRDSFGRPTAALPAVAQIHERQCGRGAGGWPELLRDRAENPEAYESFDREFEKRMRSLREGRFDEAAQADGSCVPRNSPAAGLLKIEILRLRGIALLLAERPAESVMELSAAVELGLSSRPYETANLMLLLNEAFVRAGQKDGAAAAWIEAVKRAAAFAEETGGVLDPAFWERAIHLRPSGAPWPKTVQSWIRSTGERRLGIKPPGDADLDAAFWGLLGQARLARGEIRGALVAFSRGGSLTSEESLRHALRLGQARSLARQGEIGAAKALLAAPAAGSDACSCVPALGFLGALELRSGDPARALVLLKKAVEESASLEWSGRAECEGNLGVAYLILGKESDGLKWLHAAQTRFDGERDPDGLAQSLRNELRYMEDRGRERETAELRDRLRTLEEQ